MKKLVLLLSGFGFFFTSCSFAQSTERKFTRQDSLRGTIGPERAWWDVVHYDITVLPDYGSKSISGSCKITYRVLQNNHPDYMQIDLQKPMVIDNIILDSKTKLTTIKNEGNAYHVLIPKSEEKSVHSLEISYHGTPREAIRPPWDGGWIWAKDKMGRPWMSVACQGLGASVWYPCKDHQGDEPDNGATLSISVPDSLTAVGNGRLKNKTSANGLTTYQWEVTSPINNYTIIPYIGKYVHWKDTLQGEKGKLDLDFWVLDYELEKAKKQFEQVKLMLRAFEYWFGPYPFYEDGFKLVQAPHLGMEHQSAVAYGNGFKNGYLGRDLSGTGWGLKWDYIIVHESGHEWFANNITTKDIADMWVHEGFTDYSEVLFTEYYYGKKAADEYVQGLRKNISNDKPIIGPYGVNTEGSGDMYFKGANMLHTIRQVINDDKKFREILRGLNKDFYHQTVTSRQVEEYISQKSGKDLSKIFDQYLRTTNIPVLDLRGEKDILHFMWTNCVDGFNMPVKLTNGQWIYPSTKDQQIKVTGGNWESANPDKNFYIKVQKGLPE
jgi:aminopeptidase N